jgi:DnaJ-class molecular chaperone
MMAKPRKWSCLTCKGHGYGNLEGTDMVFVGKPGGDKRCETCQGQGMVADEPVAK